jgi:Na+/H+-dicarboxylate symporter
MTQQPPSLNILDMLTGMIPVNPIKALVDGNMLQIIVFALIFGVGMSLVGEKARPLLNVIEQANEVMLKIVGMIMMIAPYAVIALMAKIIAVMGISAMVPLIKYVLTIVLAIVVQGIVVYGSALYAFTRLSIIKFYRKFLSVMAFAFSTCSSNAVIPLNLDACEKRLGVPKGISSFTIPLGATINMDGSAIMQGVAAVFIAQAFGVHLSMQSQITIVIMATLSSIGAAGVPGAAIVMVAMVLQSVGLDTNGVALIVGIDRIVDMFRTTLNITGDAVGTVIVAKSERELDEALFNSDMSLVKQSAVHAD